MSTKVKNRRSIRDKRALRIRKGIRSFSGRLRLTLHKSNRNLSAQIVDDENGQTLVSASTFEKGEKAAHANRDVATQLGQRLAARAKEKSIDTVVFDRGPSKYHGVLAAFAEAAREAGLQF